MLEMTKESVKQETIDLLKEYNFAPHTIVDEINFLKQVIAHSEFSIGYDQARLEAFEAYAQESKSVQDFIKSKAEASY